MDFTVIIPARYASTRFPGKALAEIAGKPMIVHVAEHAAASGAQKVLVATDHPEIAAAAARHGFKAVMTAAGHASGTERIAEVVTRRRYVGHRIIVNVQGDEPLIAPQLIRDVVQNLYDHPDAEVSTACHPVRDAAEMASAHVVKVVLDRDGYALYFSRAPIPYARDAFAHGVTAVPDGLPVYRHIGIYGYRAGFLRRHSKLAPAPCEHFEALEQLRVLWHGYRISVAVTEHATPPGVDTEQDLERVRAIFAAR
ncbi:MAG: 3-deoxy-manno-octulosonate cytidylyltransferase [Betaproteobacteria bacterium]|nr:3-deoxy-manno-octulosonate cytidylyltransferase [Betaproteobacteria bacterium]